MTRRSAYITLAAEAVLATVIVAYLGWRYLLLRGFPLDDAWIHAVYGRSIARELTLAYNPGEPATGATSPLWAAIDALPHLVSANVSVIVALIKLIGWGFHIATVFLLFAALDRDEDSRFVAVLAATTVLFHPDLIAASVSGMEVSLATFVAALSAWACATRRPVITGVAAAAAAVARPEVAVFAFFLPTLVLFRDRRREMIRHLVAATLGSALIWGALVARNMHVSGLPLPATFYVKAGRNSPGVIASLAQGFSHQLAQFPVVDSSMLLALGVVAAGWVLYKRSNPEAERLPAALMLAGVAFCAISFVLVYPVDVGAFYHQRYVLPGVPFVLVALWFLGWTAVRDVFGERRTKPVLLALVVLFGASYALDLPRRIDHLDNDAHNIDDVQVAIGKQLGDASADQAVWLSDAGAIRYFGNAYAVDLMGLNSFQMLGKGRDPFLQAHPPAFFQIMPAWAHLDPDSHKSFPFKVFKTSSPYTVTGNRAMGVQRLVACKPAQHRGWVQLFGQSMNFQCAE